MKKIFIPLIIFFLVLLYFIQFHPIQNGSETLNVDEAVVLIQTTNPEFADYPSNNLPPKRIETQKTDGGWLVGFYVEGSGLPGILKAQCFLVTETKEVKFLGSFSAKGRGGPGSLQLSSCTP